MVLLADFLNVPLALAAPISTEIVSEARSRLRVDEAAETGTTKANEPSIPHATIINKPTLCASCSPLLFGKRNAMASRVRITPDANATRLNK